MSVTTRLYVRMNYVEGALIRLLGLAGRRGFDIASVQAQRADCGGLYEIVLELHGTRSIETLKKQIEKLYDVEAVEVIPAETRAPSMRIAGQGSVAAAAAAAAAASLAPIAGHVAI